MAFMKEALAIAFAAGILTVGVVPYLPYKSLRPGEAVPDSDAGVPGLPRWLAFEPGMPVERTPDGRPAAFGRQADIIPPAVAPSLEMAQARAVTVPVPPDSEPAMPPSLPVAEAPPATGTADPDAPWTPPPRPELIAKADARFDDGDVAGARMWLEAALDQGDADAAFRLGETYDPVVLAEWRIVGMASDVSRARTLYRRALRGGVEAAQRRLDGLPR
jgi:hypothetical protein